MEPFALIIFGITSNLAQIKLIPAIYDMAEKGLLPNDITIIGTARSPIAENDFLNYFHEVLHTKNRHHNHEVEDNVLNYLKSKVYYIDGQLDDPNFYHKIIKYLKEKGDNGCKCDNKMFYLATYPELYPQIFHNLKSTGLSKQDKGWVRLMIEKPIGSDLDSAKQLNNLLLEYFSEDQIFRLDHYLGKETLQNILTFRFGNGIFEPLMNSEFIDHIQITASENFGIGKRGGYYDKVGALKDVGQNHQLQMLAFATMDAPLKFDNKSITKQRLKILENLVPLPDKLVLGQYKGYLTEENVNPSSSTDTFYALKTYINNNRFKEIPIYIRAGKMLTETATEISIIFKNSDNRLFSHLKSGTDPNVLIYRIQPNEGIVLKILTKKPQTELELEPEFMQFCYKQNTVFHSFPDPYERLLVDAIRGDQTFFNDAEEVEAQWKFIDPLSNQKLQPYDYEPGSWGPKEAYNLIQKDGREWIEPSMNFCRF